MGWALIEGEADESLLAVSCSIDDGMLNADFTNTF